MARLIDHIDYESLPEKRHYCNCPWGVVPLYPWAYIPKFLPQISTLIIPK
jgi:hypothetical protein